jgi:hypothetical protein
VSPPTAKHNTRQGVAPAAELFTPPKGGLLHEASVGGQKFKFFPLKNYARFEERLDLYRLWAVVLHLKGTRFGPGEE